MAKTRFASRTLKLLAAVQLATLARPASAATKWYVGGASNVWNATGPTGSWSLTAGGTPGAAVPTNGDTVNITSTSSTSQSLSYNVSGIGVTLGTLTLENTSAHASETLLMSANTLTVSGAEIIGSTNGGVGIFSQTGGTNSLVNNTALFVGGGAGSTGSYILGTAGGSGLLSVSGNEAIGFSGTGSFTQNSGTHTLTGTASTFYAGFSAGSLGTYTLNSGKLTVNGTDPNFHSEYVGYGGTGSFIQSGGTNTNSGLEIGYSASAAGSYVMNNSAAFLNVQGDEIIGDSATGTVSGSMIINYGGTFNQSAGTHDIALVLIVANNANSTGAFSLSGGSLQATGIDAHGNSEDFGYGGTGSFTQSGGTNTVTYGLDVGFSASATGAYVMNSAAAVLNVEGGEIIGDSATGTVSGGTISSYGGAFNQSAGTHVITGFLTVANNANSTGSFTLGGGSFHVTGTDPNNTEPISEYVGYQGTGHFTQSGGTHAITDDLDLGYSASAVGSYVMNNAAAVLSVNGKEIIGDSATGSVSGGTVSLYGGMFNQSAGTHVITSFLNMANNTNSTGSYSFSGGSLQATGTDPNNTEPISEYVGYQGTANFTQSGGTNTTTGGLDIGYLASAAGAYVMNNAAATLIVNGDEILGDSATGTVAGTLISTYGGSFNQSAGTHVVKGSLFVGYGYSNVYASGAFTLSGGSLTVDGDEVVNYGSAGTFTQSGGTQTVKDIQLGIYDDYEVGIPFVALYSVNNVNAILNVSNDVTLSLGRFGVGNPSMFNVLAGTVTIGGNVTVSNSSINANEGGTPPPTAFNVSGGVVSIAGTLDITGPGALIGLSAGILNVGTLDISANPPGFQWSGGILGLTAQNLDVSDTGLFGKTLTLSGTKGIVAYAGMRIAPDAAVNVLAGSMTIPAGATAINLGIFNETSGVVTVNGAFINNGAATFGGTQSWGAASVFVNLAGTAAFNTAPSSSAFGPVVVVTGGTVTFGGVSPHLSSLTVGAGAMAALSFTLNPSNPNVLFTGATTLGGATGAWTGKLDLADNDMVVHNGILTDISNQIKQGYNISGVLWGGNGIVSSVAGNAHAIGYMNGANYLLLHNAGDFSPGYTVLTTDVLLKYTYMGDANMDGKITAADYAQLDSSFLLNTPNPTWLNGDFNYDGHITYLDYAAIDAGLLAYQTAGSTLAQQEISQHAAEFGPAYLAALQADTNLAPIPEPATLSLVSLCLLPLLPRRRR